MLNRYSLWKNLVIIAVVVISSIIALPNLFGEDPAVQISPTRTTQIDDSLNTNIKAILANFNIKRVDQSNDNLLVRFFNTEDQLKAKDLLEQSLGRRFNVALNQSTDIPVFLQKLGLSPMYLGLDLRGGVNFLMEVDMKGVLEQMTDSYLDDLRTLFKDKNIEVQNITRQKDLSIEIVFKDQDGLDEAQRTINSNANLYNLVQKVEDGKLALSISPKEIQERETQAVQQNISTLRNRVNELGVAEPSIVQQGNRIVVQLPGIQDTAKAKQILGSTATLEFRMVDERSSAQAFEAAKLGRAPLGTKLYYMRDSNQPVLLKRQVILTGDSIVNASSGQDQQTGIPQVSITLDSKGADKFGIATKANIGKPMATVFIENHIEIEEVEGKKIQKNVVTEEVVNIATINSQLFKNFQITGMGSAKDASDLAMVLRSGALATPIHIIEERTIGPSAGKENISKGFNAAAIAMVLVSIFMLIRYRTFGMIANVALLVNLVMIIAALSLLQATLTLPGIAGIVLSLGMSVDANVLIYERIREDLKSGVNPQIAIDTGFKKAFDTIMDANITSLIAAVVLFGIGSGPIKGFAITLSLGIITSIFTAVILARAIVNWIYGNKSLKTLSIGGKELFSFLEKANFDFMKHRAWYMWLCGIVIILCSALIAVKGFNYGLDFTGGTVIELSYEKPVEIETVKKDLEKSKIENAQVQYFGSSKDIVIRLPVKSVNLINDQSDGSTNASQNQAALLSSKILESVEHSGNHVDVRKVEFVGSQVGEELVSGGAIASIAAILGILIYIWIRFEWKLAIGSILSTVHDTFFVIGIFVILKLEFDLTSLAAILAVIGYSVNDTVVVLDRIRENFRKSRKGTTIQIVNSAINETLSRTIMTSVTTFLAVLALYLFGGSAVESFSLAMIVGVVVGTYSSIFIAAACAVVMGLSKEDLMPPTKEELEEEFP